MRLKTIALALMLSASVYAKSPFAGTWKENRAKAQLDSTTGVIIIEPFQSGIRYSTGAAPIYAGTFDESENPGLGSMATDTFKLKKVGNRGYDAVLLRNGKVISRERIEVSDDGKKLTQSFTIHNPKDGSQTTNVRTFNRT